jgi:hypothetical protein
MACSIIPPVFCSIDRFLFDIEYKHQTTHIQVYLLNDGKHYNGETRETA